MMYCGSIKIQTYALNLLLEEKTIFISEYSGIAVVREYQIGLLPEHGLAGSE